MSETEERYAQVAGGFDARVQAAPDESWKAEAPCEGWKARDVVSHVVDNHRRLISGAKGGENIPMGLQDDPKQAWSEVFGEMKALTGDSKAMETVVDGPVGPMPLGQVLDNFVSMDVLIHTWDLARAVGGDEKLDPESVQRVHEAMTPMDSMIRQPGIFGPKLEPPAGADAQTSLLYFLGRRA